MNEQADLGLCCWPMALDTFSHDRANTHVSDLLPLHSMTGYCLCNFLNLLFEPAHEILVLITEAISKGSGESAHLHSLTRAFAVCTHEVCK